MLGWKFQRPFKQKASLSDNIVYYKVLLGAAVK